MTAAEFDAVLLLVNHMSPERREAARLALVEGQTEQSIASQFGWGRTAVNNAETAVWKVYERYLAAKKLEEKTAPLPQGWARTTVAAPRALIRKIEADVAEADAATRGQSSK